MSMIDKDNTALNRNKYVYYMFWFVAFAIASLAFSIIIIKKFIPLAGSGDTASWEYMGFYLKVNYRFSLWPQLNFVNDQVFYPYGTNSVFQSWGIERDIFYAVCSSLFGSGAWLQIYYLLTVLITGVGTFFLLLSEYGFARGGGAGFLVSFANFYAVNKYPGHLNLSITHWTTLSLICDFLIVKRVVLKRQVSLKLALFRTCLLIFSFGQDLGTIAGFALTSFTISIAFIFLVIGIRFWKREVNIKRTLFVAIASYKKQFLAIPRLSLFVLLLSLTAAFAYLPLVFQIVRETRKFDFSGVPGSLTGSWWVNPLRLLIPFLPMLNPIQYDFKDFLIDVPEGSDGSIGCFLLISGLIGLWQARKCMTMFTPLIIIFLLCLLYQPLLLPTLKIFPWFAFNRIPGRSTVIYPVIFCLFALHIDFGQLRNLWKKALSILLVLLACTEIYTFYSIKKTEATYHQYDQGFWNYMEEIKKSPGEAVLDWPFCVTGGNAVGAKTLCPYWSKNSSTYALRRFHGKKVMGQYFGRLHPSQIEPYIKAGWEKLFFPNSPDIQTATRQTRCFRSQELSFFTDFYQLNDFAGLNLYVDLLPEDCVNQIHKHFGSPAVTTVVPSAGKVQFIPKPSDLRELVNPDLGFKLVFDPVLDLHESNLLEFRSPYGLSYSGLDEISRDAHGYSVRPNQGLVTELSFRLDQSQALELSFQLTSSVANQSISVEINDVPVIHLDNLQTGELVGHRLIFEGVNGKNTISFKYHSMLSFLDIFKSLELPLGINRNHLKLGYRNWRNQKAVEFSQLKIKAMS